MTYVFVYTVSVCVLVGVRAFLQNPPTSPVYQSTTTSSYSPRDQHCTCNVNLQDVPTGASGSCSQEDALKIRVSKLETEFQQNIRDLLDDNNSLRDALTKLQSNVTSLEGISGELKCARDVAKEVEGNVTRLLDNVLTNGSVVRPAHCLPVLNVPTLSNYTRIPRDCLEVYAGSHTQPGAYQIYPDSSQAPFSAYCDHGWTYIQRRFDGSQSFDRYWDEYAMGFGDPSTEYWLGLEHVTKLTSQFSQTTLRLEMTGWTGKQYWAQYDQFSVDAEEQNYTLHVGNYSGNYKDGLSHQDGASFSAKDQNNVVGGGSCLGSGAGGWWFKDCSGGSLNQQWDRFAFDCMKWVDRCMKSSVMKIIPTKALGPTIL